ATAVPALTWSTPVFREVPPLGSGPVLGLVSCATPALCVGFDGAGSVLTATSPAADFPDWQRSVGTVPFKSAGSLSCVTAAPVLCVATNATGIGIATSTDPAGGAPWSTAAVPATVVSCQSSSLCVGGGTGSISSSTNPTGGAAAWQTIQLDASHQI